MAKAFWGGKVIAESNATVVIEGNQYFPPDAVKKELLKPSIKPQFVHGRALLTTTMSK